MEKRTPNFASTAGSNDPYFKDKGKSTNIKVIVRTRPPIKSEFGKEIAVTCNKNQKTINIDTNTNVIQSTLDGAFDGNTTQQEIFSQIQEYIPAVIQGYNCTIFAYGQTGSGKTHTMFGSDWENTMFRSQPGSKKIQNTFIGGDLTADTNFSGLIPRTIFQLFKELQKEENKVQGFAVYCSFLQIYNEKIFDLLTAKGDKNALIIRENKMDGIYVEGLTEFCVSSFEDCLMLMQKGEKNRFIRHTSSNVKSSRSHTIFQIIVESTKADASGKLQKAKFNLCDLAGSEKLNKSEDIVNAHLSELKNINLSLTTLGKVIHNLSLGQKLPIPYRESKLTRLLQDSLGGNTNTCLIATLNPILEYVDETLNTIKFAERAKHIVTEVIANKIEAVDAELIVKLQKEIKYLKEILNIRRKGTSAINEVHNKLLILQEENDRLRQHHLSVNEVEKLMEENRHIKMELQYLKSDVQSERAGENPRDFEVTGGLSKFSSQGSQGFSSPFAKGDILDYIQEGEHHNRFKRKNTEEVLQKSNTVFELGPQFSRGSRSPPGSEGASPFHHMSGKREAGVNPLALLPSRIKGKTNPEVKQSAGKPPRDINRSSMDTKKQEQQRALQRLQNLEDWQRKMRDKEIGSETSSKGRFSDVQQTTSETISVSSSIDRPAPTNYQFAEFDKMYDPYKVRQEIEKKYNTKARSGLTLKRGQKSEDNARLKNIEKNFFLNNVRVDVDF